MTLLQNVIRLYLEEHHPNWAVAHNNFKQMAFTIYQRNGERYPRIYIEDSTIHYRNTNDEWISELWTNQTVLQQITAAISNIYDYEYRCSKLSKSQTNPKFKTQQNNDTT